MRVLLIEDEPNQIDRLTRVITGIGHDVKSAFLVSEVLKWSDVELRSFDVALIDKQLAYPEDGLEKGPALKQRVPRLPLVMLTAHDDVEYAVKAIKSGFDDFLSKGKGDGPLRVKLNEIEKRLRLFPTVPDAFGIIGHSQQIRDTLDTARRYAGSTANVLLRGESGTGKELIANAIHALSRRASQAFVKINCAALPETLLESELFGHEKGAFTGAVGQQIGRFELADRGTLFLDEIGDMTLSTQAKILRALAQKEIDRLGGHRTIHVDVRIVAATNRNLEDMVQAGAFREDLFFRLNVLDMVLPPLRERGEDIIEIARYLLSKSCVDAARDQLELDDSAIAVFSSYAWPGNVRELENVLTRAVIVHAHGPRLTVDDLPDIIRKPSNSSSVVRPRENRPGSTSGDTATILAGIIQGHLTDGRIPESTTWSKFRGDIIAAVGDARERSAIVVPVGTDDRKFLTLAFREAFRRLGNEWLPGQLRHNPTRTIGSIVDGVLKRAAV